MAAFSELSLEQILSHCKARLEGIVHFDVYEYAPCYLWYDRPLFDEFGEVIRHLRGDTIYLQRDSATPLRDLFHELGHVAGRRCDLVGHSDNGYRGSWEQDNRKLIAEISTRRHWSDYLNLFALSRDDFVANAASEIWAELFMLWHLRPHSPEARLIDAPMATLRQQPDIHAIGELASDLGAAINCNPTGDSQGRNGA